jgi:hypothetical protein
VRGAGAAVLVERRRHFDDAQPDERRLDDHFGGELHPGCLQVEAIEGGPRQTAEPTVKIARGRMEEEAPDAREQRVADVPVLPRHGAGSKATQEPVAHHEIGAGRQRRDEGVQPREIIAVVRISHDDEPAAGSERAEVERGAIAANLDLDNACAFGACNPL